MPVAKPKFDKNWKKAIEDAHARAAKCRRKALDAADAALDLCSVYEAALTKPEQPAQAFYDNRTRRFYRASVDLNDAWNEYAARYIVKNRETAQTRWAKLTHWFKVRVLRREPA